MKESKLLPTMVVLAFAGVVGGIWFQASERTRAAEHREQRLLLEEQRLNIDTAEFMRNCIDDGDRTPEDCEAFLEGRWSKTKLYDGC